MILKGIKLYDSIAKECFEFILCVLNFRRFHQSSSHCFYISLRPVLLSCVCTRIFKNTKNNFSTTNIPYKQRRKSLDIGYPCVNLETMASLNSMGVGECRGHLQANRGLEYSHSFFPHLLEPGLYLSHLLYRDDFT